jgi:hypothetical protein
MVYLLEIEGFIPPVSHTVLVDPGTKLPAFTTMLSGDFLSVAGAGFTVAQRGNSTSLLRCPVQLIEGTR